MTNNTSVSPSVPWASSRDSEDQDRSSRTRTNWSDGRIAAVTSEGISRMTRSELEAFVYASGRQFLDPKLLERLKFQDHGTLMRLAYLGRYRCQNWIHLRREAAADPTASLTL